MVRASAATLIEAGLDPVVVVLGADADRVASELESLPVRVARNEGWRAGMASSIRCGLRSVAEDGVWALVAAVDQPGLTAGLVRRLLDARDASAGGEAAVVPATKTMEANGVWGLPVLFSPALARELDSWWAGSAARAASGAEGPGSGDGARGLLREHRDRLAFVRAGAAELADFDTERAYRDALDRARSARTDPESAPDASRCR